MKTKQKLTEMEKWDKKFIPVITSLGIITFSIAVLVTLNWMFGLI